MWTAMAAELDAKSNLAGVNPAVYEDATNEKFNYIRGGMVTTNFIKPHSLGILK